VIRDWRWLRRSLGTFGAPLALVLCALVIALSDQLWRLDYLAYNGFLRAWERTPAAPVLIVAIDEPSLARIGRWPWSRRIDAELIERLTAAGAGVIGLDLAIAAPASADPAADVALAEAIAAHGRVVLPVVPTRLSPAGQVIEVLPTVDLHAATAILGHVEVVADPDGIVRRHHLEAGLGVPYWPSLSLAMLQLARGPRPTSWLAARGAPEPPPDQPYPWVRGREVLLPFVGPPGTFARIPAADVLAGVASTDLLKDRLVLVGLTAGGLGDRIMTPVSERPMPAVEFHANALSALLGGELIHEAAPVWRMLAAALLTAAACVVCIASPRWSLPSIAGLALATLLASFMLMRFGRVWLPPAPALFGILLAYPIWSWQHLRRTAGTLERELRALSRGLSVEPDQGAPSAKLALDFLSSLLPVAGGSLWDSSNRLRLTWDRPPSGAAAAPYAEPARVPVVAELADGAWRAELLWLGNGPPSPGERLLLATFAHRLAGLVGAPGPGARRRRRLAAPIELATVRLNVLRHFIADSLTDMPEGVLIADSSGWVLLANHQVTRHVWGKAADQQRARLDRADLLELLSALTLRSGESWPRALRAVLIHRASLGLAARNPAGRELLVQMAPFGRDGPIASGVIVNIADITGLAEGDQRRVGRMLFEAEQRALVTLHAIADAVIFVDAHGRIDYLNRAAERLTGYPLHEARGRPVAEVVQTIDERSREPVPLPSAAELEHDLPARLNAPCGLISRWGQEAIIKVSAALLDSQEREVAGIVLTLSDITEARLLAARVTHQATHDALTGVPNRILLEDRLQLAIARARRLGSRLTVLFVDLDRFKTINDGFGHGIGDMLLVQVTERLRSRLRAEDTLARLGGDEFVVLAENAAQRHAIDQLANKLRDAFAEPFLLEHEEIYVSATIGIAVYPQDGHDVASLLKSADQAMYRAKEISRGTIQHFARPQRSQARDRLAMDRDLRRALEREEFELWYQPQLELRSQRIVGVEALLRWRAPGRGLLPPGAFIGHAEDIGLILAIDEWVLAAACAQARRWQTEGLEQARISVNMSGRQFMRRDIGRVVENALQRAQVAPERLAIEITESAFVFDLARARANMAVLRMIGLSLAIDDFGTGFSSLSYLREFPIDVLKIDRSFVQDADGARGGVIAKAVIELAHGLRLRALAEGVETRAQLKAMRRSGCDELQGAVFSAARPAAEVALMLQQQAGPQAAASPDRATL